MLPVKHGRMVDEIKALFEASYYANSIVFYIKFVTWSKSLTFIVFFVYMCVPCLNIYYMFIKKCSWTILCQ